MRRFWLILLLLTFGAANAVASESALLCGVADGFPPYQFQDKDKQPLGIDVDIATAVAAKLGVSLDFHQSAWDDVVTSLRLGKLDFISGIEINGKRRRMFSFTEQYYTRKIVVFALKHNTSIKSLYDLQYKVIAGDRHSYVEKRLDQLRLTRKIRIHQTPSKDVSFQLLKRNEVVAVIAPKSVGLHLAHKYEVPVKIIEESDPGSKVAMAVEQGNGELLQRLNTALRELEDEGVLEKIFKRWHYDVK